MPLVATTTNRQAPPAGAGSPAPEQEAACIRAVLAGSRERFGELVSRYQNAVFAVALSCVQDPHQAEDLAQEIFLKAYSALGQLRAPEAFGSWLLQIARHHASRSGQRKRAQREQPLAHEAPVPAPEDSSGPARVARVLALVEELPEPYREVVRLKYQDDLSCKEIAARAGVPIGTITSRLTRALILLRTALKP